MKNQSVFINLLSSHSLEYFPNNNSSHFSNVLQNSVYLDNGSYEVGVCEFFFHGDTVFEDKPDSSSVQILPVKKKFFDESPDSNKVICVKSHIVTIKYAKKDESLVNFFDDFKTYLETNQKSEVKIKLSKQYAFGFGTLLTVEDQLNEYALQISKSLAEVLGFKETICLSVGTYTSDFKQSAEAFERIPLNETITVRLIRQEVSYLFIDEPEDYEIDALIENIVVVFQKNNFKVRMPFDSQSNKLNIFIDETDFRFTLPSNLNEILGKPKYFTFTKSEEHIQLLQITNTENLAPSNPQIKQNSVIKNEQIFILTNIIETVFFGSIAIPVTIIVSSQSITIL
jgi:hypothetical protein